MQTYLRLHETVFHPESEQDFVVLYENTLYGFACPQLR